MSPTPPTGHAALPRIPAYAWAWLQRSRPVLAELSQRLAGQRPSPGFVDGLRQQVEADPFVRDVLIDVIAEVAFKGRVPRRRPPGVSWDRGLTWWAATLVGMTPKEFEEASGPASMAAQHALFDPPASDESTPLPAPAAPLAAPKPGPRLSPERRALIIALSRLLEAAEGEAVPAAAIRSLLDDLAAG